jgi:predicted AAA+ superfamily ATPase
MYREALIELKKWRSSPIRKPLLLRGARQVGKSWIVREFGHEFTHFVEINFEKQPEAGKLFEGDIDVKDLINKLNIYTRKKIIPGETLLFLDEIQECPRAITTLRYFKEELPELHVIAAGSLIDFVLEEIGMSVGRVQFLYLYPLSFYEFLLAQNRQDLCDYIAKRNVDPVIHTQLLEQVKTYFWLGGMPAVVKTWLETKDSTLCQELQEEIIRSYKQDFSKYRHPAKIEYLDLVFDAIPKQLAKKFKYSNIDPHIRSTDLKIALDALCKAGIAYTVCHSSAQGFPLSVSKKSDHFKVFLFDIGLAQRVLRFELDKWLFEKIEVQHIGAIAEQFVAQEYIAYTAKTEPANLFYWHREARTSNAEVDFIFVKNNDIIPVEVKSSAHGSLRSLHQFLEGHEKSHYGLRISEHSFHFHEKIVSVPLYGIKVFLDSVS